MERKSNIRVLLTIGFLFFSLMAVARFAFPGSSIFSGGTHPRIMTPYDGMHGNQPMRAHSYIVTTPEEMSRHFREDQKNIFFILISNNGMSFIDVCGIESASKSHPDWTIYLLQLIDKTVMDKLFQNQKERSAVPNILAHSILALPNVENIFFTCDALFKDTVLADICTEKDYGHYYYHYLSDAMRLVFVYLFGGAYSDLDLIFVEKNGMEKYNNFLCYEDPGNICNAAMKFEKGHSYLKSLIDGFVDVRPDGGFGFSATRYVTRHYNECKDKNGAECQNVNIESREVCYPIPAKDVGLLLSDKSNTNAQEFLRIIYNDPKIITIHMFSQMILRGWVAKKTDKRLRGRTSLVGELMFRSCPMTFNFTQDTVGYGDDSW